MDYKKLPEIIATLDTMEHQISLARNLLVHALPMRLRGHDEHIVTVYRALLGSVHLQIKQLAQDEGARLNDL